MPSKFCKQCKDWFLIDSHEHFQETDNTEKCVQLVKAMAQRKNWLAIRGLSNEWGIDIEYVSFGERLRILAEVAIRALNANEGE